WDLSHLPMDCRSAWAPLAAALILASDGIPPETGIWGTGAWRPAGGIASVGGLDRKLDLALAFGARTIFIPAEQRADAERWTSSHPGVDIEIAVLEHGEKPDLRSALRSYVARSASRPGPESSLDLRRRYYLRQVDRELQRNYYIQDLLPELAVYYRDQLPPACRPTHLVTIASQSPELVILLANAIKPRRCLILYTQDNRGHMETAMIGVRRSVQSCDVQPRPFTKGDAMAGEIRQHVLNFTQAVSPGDVLFDLTPGHKEMSLVLALRVAPRGSYLFYLRHDTDPDTRAAIPETRKPFVELAGWPRSMPE
ncbi:MAG TPA: hypothetical protein VFF52_25330, partial [Isosphaeraceae bacterium]|nr:hypothetical protein [Isosphaeraceae bacterium]